MKYNMFLLKYGEIGVKGKNKYIFEDKLVSRVNEAMTKVGSFKTYKRDGRIYTKALDLFDYTKAVSALKKVFGLVSICPTFDIDVVDPESLYSFVVEIVKNFIQDKEVTFKVNARRSNKGYPLNSMEINCELGEAILYAYPNTKVDVHKPQLVINIEVRERIFIYLEEIKGLGGMPVSTSKTGMLLLSGGIDSPVAGWMMAKRGMPIVATYFHAPPYTSEQALQKVKDLAEIIAQYSGKIKLHIVNFTDIQLHIYNKCPHDELTIIMRRYMMRIAQDLALKNDALALITGESVGQVASQTVESLNCTNEVCKIPVFRPLIAFDKQDIVELSQKIGTFETSIQPFEDCCTIFVAKHPVTKPNLDRIKKSEKNLDDINRLYEEALNSVEIIEIQ